LGRPGILVRHGNRALPKVRSIAAKHSFGGPDTEDKLARLRAYLPAFTTALKHQGFALVYIDAFAGSGKRTEELPALSLLGGNNAEPQTVDVPGSARLAIETTPPFHRLVLIENHPKRYAALEELRAEFSNRQIECHKGDANAVVQEICRTTRWHGVKPIRGVIFLDPYGMEVEWATVQAIAQTKALDVWYLFPLMGIYRQAANDAVDIDDSKRALITRVLGTHEWGDAWYGTPHGQKDMFGHQQTPVRTVNVDTIESYVKSRLETVFKGAVLEPFRTHTKKGAPLASLFFAVSNPSQRAVQVATDIARHILRQPARRSRRR
jgi:three-Cys-motif partner protein